MASPDEYIKADQNINIASYVLYVPVIVLWIGLLVRMLISRDRDNFYGLIVISILMIVS